MLQYRKTDSDSEGHNLISRIFLSRCQCLTPFRSLSLSNGWDRHRNSRIDVWIHKWLKIDPHRSLMTSNSPSFLARVCLFLYYMSLLAAVVLFHRLSIKCHEREINKYANWLLQIMFVSFHILALALFSSLRLHLFVAIVIENLRFLKRWKLATH